MGTFLFLGIAALIVVLAISVYNRLITLRNRFKNAFAQIDVQLQRRHDLIPNLVEAARAYMAHEKDTLSRVTEARNQAESARQAARSKPDDASAIAGLGRAESMLSGSLANVLAVSENYPDLKANQSIAELMEELSSTENRVGFARQAFNDAVMDYNTYREQVPNNIVAGLFGGTFQHAELLDIETPEARKAPKVQF